MKFAIPEISWHNRDPVLSVDFQPKKSDGEPLRLATGGTDTHVLIWYVSLTDIGSVNLEVAADLARHQKAVNVVRWSPSGQFLASGDDESIIFVWKHKTDEKELVAQNMEGEEVYKEIWVVHKTLRGHMEDVLDLSWSPNSVHLASGSVDNKLLLWDVSKGKHSTILSDHKGFVQGVAWDPKQQYIASVSSDRMFRTFDVTTKKVTSRSSKAVLPFPSDHPLHNVLVRLYHDDTLQTYYRRLHFSPDGMLIAVPAGKIEPEQGKVDSKPINAVYIYTRHSLKVPACILPCGEPALACRWRPARLRPRAGTPAWPLPARQVLAVATKRSVLLYDTHQKTPIALVSNIHYTRLTDLTWSPDGRMLVASSTDGYCSVITFNERELGEDLPEEVEEKPAADSEPMEIQNEEPQPGQAKEKTPKKTKEKIPEKQKNNTPKIDSFIKFKAPEKSPKKQKITTKVERTPVKLDILVDTAMPSWSDNSSNDIIKPKETMEVDNSEIIVLEDSEDIKLVYEETEQGSKSPKCNETEEIKKPSWSDNSSNDIIKPKETMEVDNSEIIVLEDSEDNKLVHEETEQGSKSPKCNETEEIKKPIVDVPKPVTVDKSDVKDTNFFKQAKVTDLKEPVSGPAVASPKAPRRVSFITLSSPKNSKKK